MIEPSLKKPPLFRRTLFSLVNGWRRVMDVKYNPLKYIPDPSLQTYFMLVLFTIWSVWFGFLASNYLGFFNYNTVASIIIHCAILLPLAFTNAIFKLILTAAQTSSDSNKTLYHLVDQPPQTRTSFE